MLPRHNHLDDFAIVEAKAKVFTESMQMSTGCIQRIKVDFRAEWIGIDNRH